MPRRTRCEGAHEMTTASRLWALSMPIAVVLAAGAIASCTPSHSVQQVSASNPSVTYEYRGDQELLQAQHDAMKYCNRYQSSPRMASMTSVAGDGVSTVIFECDPSAAAAAPPQQVLGSNLTYSYRTDQQLLDASHSAWTHCMNNGLQLAVADFGSNMDGSRNVRFQCTRG
jgi:hypothetical protein